MPATSKWQSLASALLVSCSEGGQNHKVQSFGGKPRDYALVIMHTLVTMTNALQTMALDGHTIDNRHLASLSPYQTEHINRFGNYNLDTSQEVMPLEPAMNISLLENVMSPSRF